MIITLAKQIKEYKLPSFLTPVFMIGEVIMEMIIPLLMASIIDKGVDAGDMGHIYKVGGLMVLTAIFSLIFGCLGAVFGAKASTGFAKNLRQALYEKIQTFSFSNIDRFSTASLVTRLTTDVNNIQMAYQMILRMCMRAPVSLVVALFMSFMISAKLASVYLAAIFFLGICLSFIIYKAMGYFRAVFEKYDALNASVRENVTAIREVKAYVREEQEIGKFRSASENIYNMFVKAEGVVVNQMPLMMLTVNTCILLISWIGAKMIVGNELTTGQLMSLLAYCMNILMNLMMLSMIFVMMTLSSASAKRIYEVLVEEPDMKDPEDPKTEAADGSVSFRDVTFRYYAESERPVLDHVSLEIASGETVGIIGGTGSAKTSLINMISRLYDVSEGSVLVGGVDVRDYDMDVLRREVSVVLQKNVLFAGSVMDNLKWGNENATLEDCKRACRLACADEFLDTLADGYDARVEQGGANFSGGQRQRLCIARALMKNPKILILDDSTSAVDTATDAKIRAAFASEIPDTTKLIIAQRISSISHADKIIVMEDGRINGIGTHEQLLESNAIYRDIYESQSGGNRDFDA